MTETLDSLFQSVNDVTLKLTPGCNLSCSYCNFEALSAKTPRMAMSCLKQIADLLIPNSKSPFVGLEFHGGEPLLLTDDWFEEAVGYARELAWQHGKTVEFPLVTNGTMLTEKRLRRLIKLDIRLCISCDGPPQINDILRGGGERVARALALTQQMGIRRSVMTVASLANYDRMTEIMGWFAAQFSMVRPTSSAR